MSTFDMESAALGSIAAVPALTDPFAVVVGLGGIAMGVVLFIAGRSFAPTRPDHPVADREKEAA